MGMFDKRREQLGIKTAEPAKKSSSGGSTSGSAFDRRRASLQQEKEERRQQSIRQAAERVETAKPSPLPSVENQLRTATTAFTPQSVNRDLRPTFGPPAPTARERRAAVNDQLPGRDIPVIGQALQAIDKLQEFTEPAAKVAEQYYTPGAGLSAITGATAATGNLVSRVAPKLGLGSGILPTIGREAIKESVVGAPLAAGQSLASNPRGGLEEAGKQALLGAGLGAVGGGALAGLGRGAGIVAENAAERVIGNQLGAARSIQQAGDAVTTGRLKVGGPDTYVNRVMSEISPIVTERITPPLENPNELAKWLQPHLGDTSLNEIRKLPYEDMRQLANDVRSNMNMYDVARSVASERGYDLDGILSGNTPNFRNEVERLRMGRVAGAIDAPQNARMALSSNAPEAPVSNATKYKEPWFNKLFGNQSVGITAGQRDAKELIDTHIVSNPKEPGAFLDRAGEIVNAANQDYVDRFVPFKKIDAATYDAAMDSTRSNNLATITIKDKFVDLEGNVIGNSLKDVYSTVPRGQKHIADRYLILRDSVDRMDRNIQVYGKEQWFPQTSEEAANLVAKLEAQHPWLENLGSEWNQFNRNRQDLWVQSGIASQQFIDTLRFTNPNYAPMFRQQPRRGLNRQLALNTSKAGFSNQRAPVKRAVGSSKKIIEPAQGMIETTASSYNAMMRNRAMQKLYEAVRANPERYQGVMEIVEESADARQATIKAINDAMQENGPDGVADLLNDEVNNLFKKAKQTGKTGDSIVTVMIQGEPVKMRVTDPSLLKAIDGITPNQLEGVMAVADSISRLVKQSATGLLAPLQGARLAFRDLPIAAAQSKDKVRFLSDISHAMISQVGDWLPNFVPGAERLGRLAREYYRAGGGYEAYIKGDSRIRAASRDITRDPLLSGRNLIKQAVKYNPLRPLKELGDAMENIPRIAAYAAEMRKSGWNRTPENVRRAIDAGREATVNWSRRGAKTQGIEAFAPYTNAAIQGTYRLAKRFKDQPISATALIAAMAGAKIAAHEKFKDDPDYQQRSKFDKGIPVSKTKDGKFISIPVEPTEAYIADQVLNFYKWATGEGDMPGVKANIQTGVEAFTPSLISGPISAFTKEGQPISLGKETAAKTFGGTVLDPLIAGATGKNYFGGDIVPPEYQRDPVNIQYNETTSAPGRWAAENLGIDAFTFDYLGSKFGGDIAKIALPVSSEVGRGDIQGNIIDQVNARVRLLEDPVMRNNISDDFYKLKEAVDSAKAISDKKGTPLPNWYQSAYDEVTSMKKTSISKIVSELNAKKKEIQRNTMITAKDRADQLRDVQREINMIRIQGIKRLEELGVKN